MRLAVLHLFRSQNLEEDTQSLIRRARDADWSASNLKFRFACSESFLRDHLAHSGRVNLRISTLFFNFML